MTSNQISIETDALVVELDNTLIRTNILFEQVLRLLKSKPLSVLHLIWWLLRGTGNLKSKLAIAAPIDPGTIPYRQSVLQLLVSAQACGKQTILTSSSDSSVVQGISDHLGLFEHSLTSTDKLKLCGAVKVKTILHHLDGASFTYLGYSPRDLPTWKSCHSATLINPSGFLTRQVHSIGIPYSIVNDRKSSFRLILREMRVYQWVKNALLFVPLLAAHKFTDLELWKASTLAALSFSLVASAVYVMNDLLDVDSDRAHTTKRKRPFASGDLPLQCGFALLPLLLSSGFLLAESVGWPVVGWVSSYFCLNILYSWKLKESPIIDTILLASFYTMRILTGSAATGIVTSTWLLAFSIFLFFGLALVKRYAELLRSDAHQPIKGRGYSHTDKLPVFVIGIASSLLAIVILVLYLNSQEVLRLYTQPERIWLITPVLLYWTSRLWLLANRGDVNEDAVLYSIKDSISWAVLAASICILYSAI